MQATGGTACYAVASTSAHAMHVTLYALGSSMPGTDVQTRLLTATCYPLGDCCRHQCI